MQQGRDSFRPISRNSRSTVSVPPSAVGSRSASPIGNVGRPVLSGRLEAASMGMGRLDEYDSTEGQWIYPEPHMNYGTAPSNEVYPSPIQGTRTVTDEYQGDVEFLEREFAKLMEDVTPLSKHDGVESRPPAAPHAWRPFVRPGASVYRRRTRTFTENPDYLEGLRGEQAMRTRGQDDITAVIETASAPSHACKDMTGAAKTDPPPALGAQGQAQPRQALQADAETENVPEASGDDTQLAITLREQGVQTVVSFDCSQVCKDDHESTTDQDVTRFTDELTRQAEAGKQLSSKYVVTLSTLQQSRLERILSVFVLDSSLDGDLAPLIKNRSCFLRDLLLCVPESYLFHTGQDEFFVTTDYFLRRFAYHFAHAQNKVEIKADSEEKDFAYMLSIESVPQFHEAGDIARHILKVYPQICVFSSSEDSDMSKRWMRQWDDVARFVQHASWTLPAIPNWYVTTFLREVLEYVDALKPSGRWHEARTVTECRQSFAIRKLAGLETASSLHRYELSLRGPPGEDEVLPVINSQQYV